MLSERVHGSAGLCDGRVSRQRADGRVMRRLDAGECAVVLSRARAGERLLSKLCRSVCRRGLHDECATGGLCEWDDAVSTAWRVLRRLRTAVSAVRGRVRAGGDELLPWLHPAYVSVAAADVAGCRRETPGNAHLHYSQLVR